MTRKDFFKSALGVTMGAAAGLWFSDCSSNQGPEPPPGSKSFTGSSNQGHTHSVTLQQSEVTSPPAAGISKSTSSSAGHSHTFTMTQAQLQTVNGGTAVTVTDSLVQSHTHDYVIQKWF